MDFYENSGELEEVKNIAPEIYKDVFQPTAQEVGKIIARVPRAINAALSPLDRWILIDTPHA